MTKRFIAGAVCPRCGEMDRLVSFQEDGKTVRECVACDFTEALVANVSPDELKTRVNQFEEPTEQEEVSVVKLLDPQDLIKK